jgi:hypothetical protein
VIKEINGIPPTGYPKTYNGQLSFTYGGVTYPVLSESEFAMLSEADYIIRLNAFKLYVSSFEPGINFDTDIVPGFEPYIEDLVDCPLPVATTTTTESMTTTTTSLPIAIINAIVTFSGEASEINGMEGTILACGTPFTVEPYTSMYVFNSESLLDRICVLDFNNLIAKIDGELIPIWTYYKMSGEVDWILFDGIINLNISSETTNIDIEVLISDIELGVTTTTTTSEITTSTTTATPIVVSVSNSSSNLVVSGVTVESIDINGGIFPVNSGGGTSGTTMYIGANATVRINISDGSNSINQSIKVIDSNGTAHCLDFTTPHEYSFTYNIPINESGIQVQLSDSICGV